MLPQVVLVRHGETPWSPEGRHAGRTDLPLTEAGMHEASRLALRLSKFTPDHVLTSPLLRARETARLAGFPKAEIVDDLAEWHYGMLEGMTLAEIHQQMPGWMVFRDGSPRGESVEQIIARADAVVERLRQLEGNTLVFSHGYFSRVLAARWCGLDLSICPYLMFATTSLGVLGYDRERSRPGIRAWNVRESFLQSASSEGPVLSQSAE